MDKLTYQIGEFRVDLAPADRIKFPSAADCNSPCWWRDGELFVLTATGHPVLSSGTDLAHLARWGEVTLTAYRDGGRWIESVHQEADGTLLGWYHNEPAHLVPEEMQKGRQFPLTAPFIGAVISYDNGKSWDDLGLVLSGGPDTLNLAQHNDWFAGGNGDFTVILDRAGVYFYFLFGTYYKDVAQQGVSIARMRYADRFAPVGKVTKWHNGGWSQPGLMGDVTPIFPARADWYCPEPDTFWGPSIHWNSAIEQYVILMNQAVDPSWKQGGIYISFSPDVADPSSWTEPARILAPDGWYPEVIGTGAGGGETDRALGKDARLFIHGISDYQISFSKIGR